MNFNINELHEATSKNDWELARKALKSLLQHSEQEEIIQIFKLVAFKFLSKFSTIYPDYEDFDTTIEVQFVEVTELITLHTRLAEMADKPGVSNFRNGLKQMQMFLQSGSYLTETNIDTIVDAFSAVAMAVLAQDWGIANFELWNKWYRRKNPKDFFILAEHFWGNDETRKGSQEIWNNLADEFQEHEDNRHCMK